MGLALLGTLDELAICKAYLDESIDIKGDMIQLIELRRVLPDGDQLWNQLSRRLMALVLGQVWTDRHAIAQHYEFDHDLYLSYLQATRCYSQAVFAHDDETLDEAQRRKLELALEACRIERGQHLLDVGAGWGTLTEYAGRKGIRVTSLTISQRSHEFVSDLIARFQLPCQVYLQNFLEHKAAERYDAIAILGVMEHLPDYRAVLRQFARLLKPGGRVYLDAGAIRGKVQVYPIPHALHIPRKPFVFLSPRLLEGAHLNAFRVDRSAQRQAQLLPHMQGMGRKLRAGSRRDRHALGRAALQEVSALSVGVSPRFPEQRSECISSSSRVTPDVLILMGSPDDPQRVVSLAEALRALWKAGGSSPDVFAFLAAHPEATTRDRLEVILIDQKYQTRKGRERSVSDYVAALPDPVDVPEILTQLTQGESQTPHLEENPVDSETTAPPLESSSLTMSRDATCNAPAAQGEQTDGQPSGSGLLDAMRLDWSAATELLTTADAARLSSEELGSVRPERRRQFGNARPRWLPGRQYGKVYDPRPPG